MAQPYEDGGEHSWLAKHSRWHNDAHTQGSSCAIGVSMPLQSVPMVRGWESAGGGSPQPSTFSTQRLHGEKA